MAASKSTNNRAIPGAHGKVVGGGSSINATIWARPFNTDLERWADVGGDRAWGYEHALSTYRRVEDWQGKPNPVPRQGQIVPCQPSQNPHPVAPATLGSVPELGKPVLDDLNGEREVSGVGFALMNHIIRDGTAPEHGAGPTVSRAGAARTSRLSSRTGRSVILSGTRAGVEVGGEVERRLIEAKSEVDLSSGGINTPKLLMLSGIGDEAGLRRHAIKAVVDAPEVGGNFQDHILHGGCIWEPNECMPHRTVPPTPQVLEKQGREGDAGPQPREIELPTRAMSVAKQYTPPKTELGAVRRFGAAVSRAGSRSSVRTGRPADRRRPLPVSHPDDVKALRPWHRDVP